MSVSVPLFFYHVICAYNELFDYPKERSLYLSMDSICAGFYIIGATTSNAKLGQQCHSTMHIIGVCANVYMYYYLSQSRRKCVKA